MPIQARNSPGWRSPVCCSDCPVAFCGCAGGDAARQLSVGEATFVVRDVGMLDVQLVETELVRGFATTAEQTALDIADKPVLGGVSPATALETLTALAEHLDCGIVFELTVRLRKHSAPARPARIASAVIDPPSLPRPRKPVPSL